VNPGFAQRGSFSKITPFLEREGLSFILFDRVEPETRLARGIQASGLGVPESAFPGRALKVTSLLENKLRSVSFKDAIPV